MSPTPMLITLAAAGVLLIAAGVWSGRRAHSSRRASVIRPIRRSPVQRLQRALANHPDPLLALVKTGFWIVMLVALVDHLHDTQRGTVAHLAWLLSIGPHEIGHFVCTPFGWLLHVAGGSIWQVLVYVLLAVYAFSVQRRVWLALLFWIIAGHSLINLSVYIADAAERDLPLLFGMGKNHHDWWNLLSHYDALRHDDLIAQFVRGSGAVIVVLTVAVGLVTAWWMPRRWLPTTPRDFVPPREERTLESLLHRDSE